MRIQTVIIHDTRRASILDGLADVLGVQAIESGALIPIICDRGSGRGPWAGMSAAIDDGLALLSAPSPAALEPVQMKSQGWLLMLEDDAVPCRGFLTCVSRAVTARPRDALYFCATAAQAGESMLRAHERGDSWALVSGCVGSVAVCLPMGMARRFLDWARGGGDAERWWRRTFTSNVHEAGDARLWWWLTHVHGRALCVTARSLVGHRCWKPEESLAHQVKPAPRRAFLPVEGVEGQDWPSVDAAPGLSIDFSLGAEAVAFAEWWPSGGMETAFEQEGNRQQATGNSLESELVPGARSPVPNP